MYRSVFLGLAAFATTILVIASHGGAAVG